MDEVRVQGSLSIPFGPYFESLDMASAFSTTEIIWAEVNVAQKYNIHEDS